MARHHIPRDTDKGRKRALDVILDATLEDQFDVIAEAVPADLPTTSPDAPGKSITWISNFRLKKKPTAQQTGAKLKYQIELTSVSGDLVYYDESSNSVIALTTRPAGDNRIQADLSVDDPPIGSR